MIETNVRQIGYILRSYPRLSQTFILNEILALEQLGLQLHLFPITNPREPVVQAVAMLIAAVYVVLNLAADVATILVSPRLRTSLR